MFPVLLLWLFFEPSFGSSWALRWKMRSCIHISLEWCLHRSLDFVFCKKKVLMANVITFGSFENFASCGVSDAFVTFLLRLLEPQMIRTWNFQPFEDARSFWLLDGKKKPITRHSMGDPWLACHIVQWEHDLSLPPRLLLLSCCWSRGGRLGYLGVSDMPCREVWWQHQSRL